MSTRREDVEAVNRILTPLGEKGYCNELNVMGVPARKLSKEALLGALIMSVEENARQAQRMAQSNGMFQFFLEKAHHG